MSRRRRDHFNAIAALAIVCGLASVAAAEENPALAGYANHEQMVAAIAEIDKSELVSVSSLGKTLEGRDIPLLTIAGAAEGAPQKPAIVIVGGVSPSHAAGGELAIRVARLLVERAAAEEPTRVMLERLTVFVIPRASPDATEKCFRAPFASPLGNARPTDDDRDGELGEDPPEDLNGDGWITVMRVADPAGSLMPHPDDARVLIEADRKKNERGQYRVYSEGRDNDGDEQFNEDPGGGVSFDRNFPFQYAYFGRAAGPHQVSEAETRAVADFLVRQPQVVAVFSFAATDNLMRPWQPNGDAERGRIKTTLLTADAPYQDRLAEIYRKQYEGQEAPENAGAEGSFAEWAYFHFGRWSLSARGWWVPKTDPPPPAEGQPAPKPSEEKRGADDLNALRWFAAKGIDGFVSWQAIEHPDFPGKTVEVGGFKPFYRLNPPSAELDGLAAKQTTFLAQLAENFSRLEIREPKAASLGGGVYRITVKVANAGYLPTMPEMGSVNGEAYPLQVALTLPEDAQFLRGHTRERIGRLTGNGDEREHEWLVRFSKAAPPSIRVKARAPAVGAVETDVVIAP
jgi:hypothetical protein